MLSTPNKLRAESTEYVLNPSENSDDLEQTRKTMATLPIPEEGCATVYLGSDFYSLALYTFYFSSQEEKTDDQIVTDFNI